MVYDEQGDGASESLALTDEEVAAFVEILGSYQVTRRLAELERQAAGLVVEQLPVPAGSPFAGRALGDTQARTRTGASVVALIRGGMSVPSPGPEFELAAGDVLVVVGTGKGVDKVAQILAGTGPRP